MQVWLVAADCVLIGVHPFRLRQIKECTSLHVSNAGPGILGFLQRVSDMRTLKKFDRVLLGMLGEVNQQKSTYLAFRGPLLDLCKSVT